MAERVQKKVVEVRILKGGDEAIVISDMAGDEIVWSAERVARGTMFVSASSQDGSRTSSAYVSGSGTRPAACRRRQNGLPGPAK